MSEQWISAETEQKERDFRGILGMHMTICNAIIQRRGRGSYLYADLYAGPGMLQYRSARFEGSPMIAHRLAAERPQMPFHALHFEKYPAVADVLRVHLGQEAMIDPRPCEVGFAEWLTGRPNVYRDVFGLVYADPIRDEIPHALFGEAAKRFPSVDLLSYVAATQYKRRRGVDQGRPMLSDHIAAVPKKIALIREPAGAWQWTFVIWSNWVNFPQWEKRGFYRINSAKGRQILERLDLTSTELHEARNVPLPIDEIDPDPPYQTYREYLKHPRFLKVRAEVFKRAAGLCEQCKLRPPTEPHHWRYPPWGSFDVPENMSAVCHQCHCEIHGKAA